MRGPNSWQQTLGLDAVGIPKSVEGRHWDMDSRMPTGVRKLFHADGEGNVSLGLSRFCLLPRSMARARVCPSARTMILGARAHLEGTLELRLLQGHRRVPSHLLLAREEAASGGGTPVQHRGAAADRPLWHSDPRLRQVGSASHHLTDFCAECGGPRARAGNRKLGSDTPDAGGAPVTCV